MKVTLLILMLMVFSVDLNAQTKDRVPRVSCDPGKVGSALRELKMDAILLSRNDLLAIHKRIEEAWYADQAICGDSVNTLYDWMSEKLLMRR